MSEEDSICQICNTKYDFNSNKLLILRFKQDKEDFCFECNLISYRFKGILDIILYGILFFISFELFQSKYFDNEFILFIEFSLLLLTLFWLFLAIYSTVLTILGFYHCLKNKELKIKVGENEKVCHNCGKNFEKVWWGFFIFFGWKKDRCLNCTLLINRYFTLIISILILISFIFYIPHVLEWDFPYNLKMIAFLAIILISSAIQAFFGFYLRIKIR